MGNDLSYLWWESLCKRIKKKSVKKSSNIEYYTYLKGWDIAGVLDSTAGALVKDKI
jgi:hypothetical protein